MPAVRIAGEVIWASNFEETSTTETSGGKGSGGSKTTTYRYFANFAVGLCEGPIAHIGRGGQRRFAERRSAHRKRPKPCG